MPLVTGIDHSPYLTAEAQPLAAHEGLSERIDVRVGDSQRLGLPDQSFDAAIAHTLVSHVPDPLSVLTEMRRVVRPGGLIGIFDGDYASLTFGTADSTQGKADDEAIISAIVTNPRVMRQMPRLVREAGLDLAISYAYVVADIGKAEFWAPALDPSCASFQRQAP